jgi:hypothetical protein
VTVPPPPTPPAWVEAAPARRLRHDLDQVAVWRLAGRLPVIEVQLFEATEGPVRGQPARAVTVMFRPLGVLERVTDPAELLDTARLLETVAGWVAAPRPGAAEASAEVGRPVPLPFPDAAYDET